MKTLQQAKADYDSAFHNAKFFQKHGMHTKESRKHLKVSQFIKPAVIYLESNPTEAF